MTISREVTMSFWRWITMLTSLVGIAAVAVAWSRLDNPGTGYLFLCSLPFVIGAAAALLPTHTDFG